MIDQQKIKQAVTLLLEGIGEDVLLTGLHECMKRYTAAWRKTPPHT